MRANIIGHIILLWMFIPVTTYAQRPPSAQSLYEKGIEHLNNEEYTQALSAFDACLKLKPKYADAYNARAEVRERLKDLHGAMTDYAICVELLPLEFEPLFSLAVLRYELKLYELAKQDFLKLKRLSAGETNWVMYRQEARGGGSDKILTAQSDAIQIELYSYLGLIELQLKNCTDALHYLDSAILLEPREANHYLNRALVKQRCGNLSAQEDFNKALAINPDHALTRHNQAVRSTQNDTNDSTIRELTKIIETDSTLQYPYTARGYYRLMNGDYQSAYSDYTRALAIDNRDPNLWLNRGIAAEKLNDLTGAFNDYTQAIERKENLINAWINRGNVLTKQKRYQDAIDDYSVALVHQSNNGQAYYNRALVRHYEKQTGACDDLLQAEVLGMTVDPALKEEICVVKK